MLPVRAIESELNAALAKSSRLVLTAPTGSGKTTQVPQMLLAHPSVAGRIIVLQPRRLAARLMASRVAQETGSPVGGLVGYQTRHERRVSEATRIVFMTEGLLLRQLHDDPTLAGVGAVLLDEFHERSLNADLLLGLLMRVQESGRPELRLVVMSATLETAEVRRHLGCEAIEARGRSYPVEVRYLSARSVRPVWDAAAAAMRDVLDHEPDGDVLIFMPGAYEIRRTIEACRRVLGGDEPVALRALHGSLPATEQDRALAPDAGRRVIVATNVAETSITIEGVRHVIDSGLARIHHHDARRGLNVLRTLPISQASATQRAGRAGRTAPGTCRRLWPRQEDAGRAKHETPEVRRLDLAEPVLRLRAMGGGDPRAFAWLDRPDEDALQRAERQLEMLDALDARGITTIGRRMARFAMHPRLARMLLAAVERDCLGRAITWAAIASERDILVGDAPAEFRQPTDGEPASDLAVRERLFEEVVRARFDAGACRRLGVDAGACRELDRTRRLLESTAGRERLDIHPGGSTRDLVCCLLVAFSDHVGMCADLHTRRCRLPGRKRVMLERRSAIRRAGPLVALEVRELARAGEANTLLSLCSEVEPAWLAEVHPELMRQRVIVEWNDERQRVEAVEEVVFDELPLERTHRPASPEAAADVLVARIQRGELRLEHWDDRADQWIARTRCVAQWMPERELLGYDDEDMSVILHEIVAGATTAGETRSRPVIDALRQALSWEDQQLVEKMAPSELVLPSGRRMKLTYQPGQPPRGKAKIQDLYGLDETPRLAAGRIPVLLEILGPNFRPVQVTDDLGNFWRTLYPSLRSELRRRYPKHEWR